MRDITPDFKDKLLPALAADHEELATFSTDEIIKHLYWQVLQSQVLEQDLRTQVERLHAEIAVLNKAISRNHYIESPWVKIRYNSRLKVVSLNNNFRVEFTDSSMSDLLEILFTKSSGRPLKKKFQCVEIRDKLNSLHHEDLTTKQVERTVRRLNDKLAKETGFSFLRIKPKEFYWIYTY